MCGLIIQFTATTLVNTCPISAGFSLAKKSTPVLTEASNESYETWRHPFASLAHWEAEWHPWPLTRSRSADHEDSKRIQQTCLMPNPAPYAGRIPAGLSAGWLMFADVCYPSTWFFFQSYSVLLHALRNEDGTITGAADLHHSFRNAQVDRWFPSSPIRLLFLTPLWESWGNEWQLGQKVCSLPCCL